MKRNKAFLEYKGRPLVEWTLEILKSTFSEVLISSNEPDLYKSFNIPVIVDQDYGKGPLAGLRTGLQSASQEISFFVACDMPFLQPDLIRYLWQWATEFDIVVPKSEFGLHPLHAYYHRRCLPHIEENLNNGSYKIIDFYPQCKVRYVEEKEINLFGDVERILSNYNTPEEWLSLTPEM